MLLTNRIKGLEFRKAANLRPHPQNWRTHPEAQKDALRGVLSEIGVADALIAFPADGKGPEGDFSDLMLFDGHLRTDVEPDHEWPVLVTDLTDDEARKMLLSLDPLAALAGQDEDLLKSLLEQTATDNEALQAVWDSLPAALPPVKEVASDMESRGRTAREYADMYENTAIRQLTFYFDTAQFNHSVDRIKRIIEVMEGESESGEPVTNTEVFIRGLDALESAMGLEPLPAPEDSKPPETEGGGESLSAALSDDEAANAADATAYAAEHDFGASDGDAPKLEVPEGAGTVETNYTPPADSEPNHVWSPDGAEPDCEQYSNAE